MLKSKKLLTISIEDATPQNEEEQQLNQLKLYLTLLKKEKSQSWSTLNQEHYEEEKQKASFLNSQLIDQLMSYFEGTNSANDLSYAWIKANQDVFNLSKCIFITPEIAEVLMLRDFSTEFKVLKTITEDAAHKRKLVTLAKCLRQNNRYADLLPYEYNITPYAFLEKCEQLNQDKWYINASYIDGPLRSDLKYFIATQYPLSNTICKFYKMCFTHGVKLIVMLSSFDEEGGKKSDKYIPAVLGANSKFTFGEDKGIEVLLQKEQWLMKGCLIKRELIVRIDDDTRVITHIQMVNWPDYLIPDEELGYESVECLIQSIIEHREANATMPIVIHCSAGIGRTGTFISIFNTIKCLRLYKTIIAPFDRPSRPKPFISVFNIIRKLREQRAGMVTSLEQYAYIYQFICKWVKSNMKLSECS